MRWLLSLILCMAASVLIVALWAFRTHTVELPVDEVMLVTGRGKIVPGYKGLSCVEDGICTAGTNPQTLVQDTQLSFAPVSSTLTLYLPYPRDEVRINMRNDDGQRLLCDVQVEQVTEMEYTFTLCADDGARYFLDVTAATPWEDATYHYPVTMK